MAKSKHFRKDVVMARIIFAILCIALIIGLVVLVSALSDSLKETEKPADTQHSESQVEDTEDFDTETSEETQVEETEEKEPEVAYFVKITGNVNFRPEPSTGNTPYGKVPMGTKCKLIEELDGWFYIEYNGQKGYVSASYAHIVEEVVTE